MKRCKDCGKWIDTTLKYYNNRKRCDKCSKKRYSKAEHINKICKHCGDKFIGGKLQIFCCVSCTSRASAKRMGDVKITSTKFMGTYSELMVCCDLLKKGYDVFRCISPCSDFDLAVYKKPHEFIRIEVKTGYVHQTTKTFNYSFPRNNEYDIIAVFVKNTQKIHYIARTSKSAGFGELTKEVGRQ